MTTVSLCIFTLAYTTWNICYWMWYFYGFFIQMQFSTLEFLALIKLWIEKWGSSTQYRQLNWSECIWIEIDRLNKKNRAIYSMKFCRSWEKNLVLVSLNFFLLILRFNWTINPLNVKSIKIEILFQNMNNLRLNELRMVEKWWRSALCMSL